MQQRWITTLRIDMRLTDDKVYEVIKKRLGMEPGRLTIKEIATDAGCHWSTAFRAVRRLEFAGRLRSQYHGTSQACTYQCLD